MESFWKGLPFVVSVLIVGQLARSPRFRPFRGRDAGKQCEECRRSHRWLAAICSETVWEAAIVLYAAAQGMQLYSYMRSCADGKKVLLQSAKVRQEDGASCSQIVLRPLKKRVLNYTQ